MVSLHNNARGGRIARHGRQGSWLGALMVVLVAVVWAPAPVLAQDDDASVGRGLAVYRDAANCDFCHGWRGIGARVEDEGFVGANLVETLLDREDLIEVIRCGRPDSPMPRFDRRTYTEAMPCFGMTKADLVEAEMDEPSRATGYGSWLRPRQIEDVVNYLLAVYVDKEMTFENCVRYNGEGSRVCQRFK